MSARARLTLVYTALALASGLAITALTFLLMRRRLGLRLVHVELWTLGGGGGSGPGQSPPPAPAGGDLAAKVRDAALNELAVQSAIALTVVTVLAALLGWWVSGRVLRPLRVISTTAQRLSAEKLSERVPVRPPRDELADLAATFNGMLDRIQTGIAERDRVLAGQRLFTANAAHELRTPLTTMRTAIDVTLDGAPSRPDLLAMAEDIRTEIARSQRTLDGLLALASSQAAAAAGPVRQEPVDLAAVIITVTDRAGEPAGAIGCRLDEAPVTGDPVLLERLAANLVDNALRYSGAGGAIEIACGVAQGEVFLRVTNDGQVIDPDDAERLLEPFVRNDSRSSSNGHKGSGLGLSIVRAIVLAHGGRINLHARPKPQGGLEVTVRLPTPALYCPHGTGRVTEASGS